MWELFSYDQQQRASANCDISLSKIFSHVMVSKLFFVFVFRYAHHGITSMTTKLFKSLDFSHVMVRKLFLVSLRHLLPFSCLCYCARESRHTSKDKNEIIMCKVVNFLLFLQIWTLDNHKAVSFHPISHHHPLAK